MEQDNKIILFQEKQLTEEWKNRGVKEGQEYAILTKKEQKY